jgi:hypothetical protein
VIPGTSERLQRQLGFQIVVSDLTKPPPPIESGHRIGEVFPLFPRKDQPK